MSSPSTSDSTDPLTLALLATALVAFVALGQSAVSAAPPTSQETTAALTSAAPSAYPKKDASGLPVVPKEARQVPSNDRITNREATIPPQCYTKTEGRFNPCFTCHQSYGDSQGERLNQASDGALQGSYSFSDLGVKNHYRNLFVDRREWILSISEEEIIAWVNRENYTALEERLREREYAGFIPDLANYHLGKDAFDERGLAKDGSAWVAFSYKPFPGTFWPTNGSTDDVLIRLPEKFRQIGGHHSDALYFLNLTLAELTLKDLEKLSIPPTSEKELGVDLNGDGELGVADFIERRATYLGDAQDVPVSFQQLPEGTELMHSVRYLGVEDGHITIPKRMKELRYMKKLSVLSEETIQGRYARERREKRLGELPHVKRRGDQGLDNGLGWLIKGFIEDYDGALRPQTYEEDLFCVGCHKGVGTTIDSTFSLARKVPGSAGWGYVELGGLGDIPSLGSTEGEILNYLRAVGGGSEFRENEEMQERWFLPNGDVDAEAVKQASLSDLILPSPKRALDLNRAYTHIVRHQSFAHGRDATWTPAQNVIRAVDMSTVPLATERRIFGWDIRLDWSHENIWPKQHGL